ncbi:hypothetical protein [Patulibacter sp.]|uniref:hypothetical protein n=1 Tax=Patulibacter sp. TaxID=1912859 RepID=UPI0027169CCA|nr:hypothetical protein [Patulibacter sp.]MDO9410087.1 hypothetical protein [Patulibacter sp.]
MTAAEAHERTLQRIEKTEEFVTITRMAWLFSRTINDTQKLTARPDFPPYTCTIGGTRQWAVEDVVAYRDGKKLPHPKAKAGYLEKQVLGAKEMCAFAGVTYQHLRNLINTDRVYPDGMSGGDSYWWKRNAKTALTRPYKIANQRPQ